MTPIPSNFFEGFANDWFALKKWEKKYFLWDRFDFSIDGVLVVWGPPIKKDRFGISIPFLDSYGEAINIKSKKYNPPK